MGEVLESEQVYRGQRLMTYMHDMPKMYNVERELSRIEWYAMPGRLDIAFIWLSRSGT